MTAQKICTYIRSRIEIYVYRTSTDISPRSINIIDQRPRVSVDFSMFACYTYYYTSAPENSAKGKSSRGGNSARDTLNNVTVTMKQIPWHLVHTFHIYVYVQAQRSTARDNSPAQLSRQFSKTVKISKTRRRRECTWKVRETRPFASVYPTASKSAGSMRLLVARAGLGCARCRVLLVHSCGRDFTGCFHPRFPRDEILRIGIRAICAARKVAAISIRAEMVRK